MKKITASLIMLVCIVANAQEKKIKLNKHFISIGYGYRFDTKWWESGIEKMNFAPPKTTNDAYLKYGYAFNKKISIGLDLAFIDVNKDGFGIFGPLFETYAYTAKAFRILPAFNYHFLNSSK